MTLDSKRLSDSCGQINKQLKLSDRVWTCSCGVTHERDFLAARNIKKFAFHPQNLLRQGLTVMPAEESKLSIGPVKQEAKII